MGRYRAPRPPSAKYITPEGAARLRRELDELWRVKRPAVTRAVSEAAAQGDRSENAEYIYGKKQLAEIDRRVRFLRKRLTGIRVVDQAPSDTSKVFFGAWFELADDDGRRTEYRLVGPDEFDFAPDYISVDAPLGRAVLGKTLGAEVNVPTPEGDRRFELTAIRYGQESEAKKSPAEAGRITGGNRRATANEPN
jgi:transcription elongation factor GreB